VVIALTHLLGVSLFSNLISVDYGEYIVLMFWHFKGITYQNESSVGSQFSRVLPICKNEGFPFFLSVLGVINNLTMKKI